MEKRSRTLPKKKRLAEDDQDSDVGDDHHNGSGPKKGKKGGYRRSNSTNSNTGSGIAPPPSSSTATTTAAAVTTGRIIASHPLDPLLLARGMSSRYLSAKTSHRLVPLSKTEIEKDLRHCEAYRNACLGYAQQHFVYRNSDSVRSGYFGAFIAPPPVGPARLFEKREKGDDVVSADDNGCLEPTLLPDEPASALSSLVSSSSAPIMPSRIDPEEEKRLSLLRKKMYASEYEREELEIRYLSLRAHYVHEVQLARKTRTYEMARWELLRGLVERRAKAVGLRRARMAMARDVECLLLAHSRGEMLTKDDEDDTTSARRAAAGDVKAVNGDSNDTAKVDVTTTTIPDKKDEEKALVTIWNNVIAQLKAADASCTEIETPAALVQMTTATMSINNSTNGAKGGRSRSGSVTDETNDEKNNDATGKMKASKSNSKGGSTTTTTNPHVIPWDCMIEPQTPYEVPILLSCLSSATDRAVGYVTDKTNPKAITWLESTLPESTSAYKDDADTLNKLRTEARILEEELKRESERNSELQDQIIASRTRSDQMVALMQLLRSETEAVLERHNVIMETPEAKAKSAELHRIMLEEKKLKNPSAGDDDDDEDEGEADENEDGSSGDDENQDDDDEEEDDDSVGIKEITVDNDLAAGDYEDDDEDDGSDDGEVAEGEMSEGDENDEEPRRSKRRGSQADDEEVSTSSVTPPNSSAFRKKRRL